MMSSKQFRRFRLSLLVVLVTAITMFLLGLYGIVSSDFRFNFLIPIMGIILTVSLFIYAIKVNRSRR